MATRIHVFIFFLILSALLLPVALPVFGQTTPDPPNIFVSDLKGDIQIIKAGETAGRPAVKDDFLGVRDQVQVGKGSSANITIEGVGEIELAEATSWSYEKFSLTEGKCIFTGNLALGRLRAKVKKLPPDSIFEIRTPVSIASVRGTFFSLFVYMVQSQIVALLEVVENSVTYSNLARDQSVVVNEGESARADESGKVAPAGDENKNTGEGPPGGGSSDDGGSKDPFDGYPPGIDNFFNRDAPAVRPEPPVYSHPGQRGESHESSGSGSSGSEDHYHDS